MGADGAAVVGGMNIEWDVPIEIDDGLILRADVFRPDGDQAGIRRS